MASKSSNDIKIEFATYKKAPAARTCIILAGAGMTLSPTGNQFDEDCGGLIERSGDAAEFKGKAKTSFEVLAPHGLDIDRLIVVGAGEVDDVSENDWTMLGGTIMGMLASRKVKTACLVAEVSDGCSLPDDQLAAVLAFGIQLRHYKFDKYVTDKSKPNDDGDAND